MTNAYSGKYSNVFDESHPTPPIFFSAALGDLQKLPVEGVGGLFPPTPPVAPPLGWAILSSRFSLYSNVEHGVA